MSANKRRQQFDNNFFDTDTELPVLDIQAVDEIGFGGMSLPVARIQNETVKMGAFSISMSGLQIEGNITKDEWWAFLDGVQKIESAIQFIIGDLASYGENTFKISYEDIAQKTGYKVETVENYAYVARNVPQNLRNNELSFNHHYIIASLDSDELKERWLLTAKEHDLSVRNLELALKIWKDGGDPQRVFDIVDDKPSPVQSARLKMVNERNKVMGKAKKKKARKLWLTYAKEQAAEWQTLADKISQMPEDS